MPSNGCCCDAWAWNSSVVPGEIYRRLKQTDNESEQDSTHGRSQDGDFVADEGAPVLQPSIPLVAAVVRRAEFEVAAGQRKKAAARASPAAGSRVGDCGPGGAP